MAIGRDTTFTWYGHSCVELTTPAGRTVIIDPWFGNPRSPRRADDVDRCDILLVTHGHFDHLGEAVPIAARTRPAIPCIHELSLWLGRNLPGGSNAVIGMNKGGTVEVGGIRITMVPAEHSSGDMGAGSANFGVEAPIYFGEAVGFILEMENGFVVYVAGDTTAFGDMRLIRELYRPELAILPIGGHFTMGPREAALSVGMLGVGSVLPVHYGTFPILAGTPGQLRDALAGHGLQDIVVHEPAPGESVR